jgi:hypothetical protein
MPESGKLEKMLILSFESSQDAESGGKAEAKAWVESLINPESYTIDYKLKFSESGQGQGTSGRQLKYEYTEPEEMTFEFLFDNTGIINNKKTDSIVEDIIKFKKVLIQYQGNSHEPPHIKLLWGENSIFKGRATEISIAYKLFKPDGTPIRAVARVKFKSSIEEQKRAATEDRKSADLTHFVRVKAGETLPLLCYRIYGDPKYYLTVARTNGLDNFRYLIPGTNLLFPPIEKTSQKS